MKYLIIPFLYLLLQNTFGLRLFQSNAPNKCKNYPINKFNLLKKMHEFEKEDKIDLWKEYNKDTDPPIIFELYNWFSDEKISKK